MISLRSFESMILFFNGMYKLPIAPYPTIADPVAIAERLKRFKDILIEEVNEVDEIISNLANGKPETEVLTDLADWLGDIQIYCASEMVKFGIPINDTLRIIMQSNFSKLGLDGNPIYDERGKVQKGPLYFKPEPALKEMLEALITEHHSKDNSGKGEPS